MKKIILILIILLLIFAGIFFSYETFNKPVEITEIKDSPFSILLENQKETFTENTDWYEVKIEYPKNNVQVRDQLIAMWNNFEKENELKKYNNLEEAKVGLQINVEGLKYSFGASYELATSSGSSTNSFGETLTYVYQIYTFTGGAHGGTEIFPITISNKLENISVEEILPNEKLEKVSKIAYEQIKLQKKDRLKSFGMNDKEINESLKDDSWIKEGTAPNRENYSRVWLEGNDLIISFGQYQVASYAEGIFEVKIPISEI